MSTQDHGSEITEEILDVGRELLSHRTTHDGWGEFEYPADVAACLEYVRRYFSGEEFLVREYGTQQTGYDGTAFEGWSPSVYDNPKPSLVVSFEETTEPEYLLHGHLDVVAPNARNRRAETTAVDDPEAAHFEPHREGERLYGRGTADMKVGVACLMWLMRAFAAAPNSPSVALAIVTDEEMGGFRGAGYLFRDVGYDPAVTISAEPSGVPEGFTVVTEQKGNFQLDVTVEGTPAHGSRPWEGDCANRSLVSFLSQLRERFPDIDDDRWQTTLNVGRVSGGETRTALAERAIAELGIRFTDEYTPVDVMADVADILGVTAAGTTAAELAADISRRTDSYQFEVVNDEPMQTNDEEAPEIRRLVDTCERVTGITHDTHREHGASDARFAAEDGRVGITFGPRGFNLHGPDEYADISSIEPYVEVVYQYVTDTVDHDTNSLEPLDAT